MSNVRTPEMWKKAKHSFFTELDKQIQITDLEKNNSSKYLKEAKKLINDLYSSELLNKLQKITKEELPQEFFNFLFIVISRPRVYWDSSDLRSQQAKNQLYENILSKYLNFLNELSNISKNDRLQILVKMGSIKYESSNTTFSNLARASVESSLKLAEVEEVKNLQWKDERGNIGSMESIIYTGGAEPLLKQFFEPISGPPKLNCHPFFDVIYNQAFQKSLKTEKKHDPFFLFTARELYILFKTYLNRPWYSKIDDILKYKFEKEAGKDSLRQACSIVSL